MIEEKRSAAERYAAQAGPPGSLTDSMPFGPDSKRFPYAMLGSTGVVAREKVALMTRHLTRDRAAVAAAVAGPLALAAILLPWRGSWPNTNVALLLVVAVVRGRVLKWGIAFCAAQQRRWSAAVWFDYFFTRPYERLGDRSSVRPPTWSRSRYCSRSRRGGVADGALARRSEGGVTVADAGVLQPHRGQRRPDAAGRHPLWTSCEHVRRQLIDVLDLGKTAPLRVREAARPATPPGTGRLG